MYPNIKKWVQWKEDCFSSESSFVRTVSIAAVIDNPYSNTDADDLDLIFESADVLGPLFSDRILSALDGATPVAYGKAALVGKAGEFEHGKAYLMNRFVDYIRRSIGGAVSWVPSTCVKALPGRMIDVPLGHIYDLAENSHRSCVSLGFPTAPLENEVVVIFVVEGIHSVSKI